MFIIFIKKQDGKKFYLFRIFFTLSLGSLLLITVRHHSTFYMQEILVHGTNNKEITPMLQFKMWKSSKLFQMVIPPECTNREILTKEHPQMNFLQSKLLNGKAT